MEERACDLAVYIVENRATVRAAAKKFGVSKSTVSCWMSQKSFPEMDTIQKIADALGCQTDDLLVEQATTDRETIEDRELRRIWGGSSIQAKKAALAVLRELAKEN